MQQKFHDNKNIETFVTAFGMYISKCTIKVQCNKCFMMNSIDNCINVEIVDMFLNVQGINY